MNQKSRKNPAFIESTCDKYLNRLMRQEKQNNLTKPNTVQHQQQPYKSTTKSTKSVMDEHSPPVKEHKQQNSRRSRSSCKNSSDECEKVTTKTRHERKTWRQILSGNRINYVDPLRTLDSLLRELKFKLEGTLSGNDEVHEMIADIQHVLKRIPSEIIATMNQANSHEIPRKSIQMLEKSCQTPPDINREDTEKLRRIMRESCTKFEATSQQLETLCTNLQNDNALVEQRLKEERHTVKTLEKKVRNLEEQLQNVNYGKLKQLEDENEKLRNELQELSTKNRTDKTNNLNLIRIINELEKQKSLDEQQLSQSNYDLTLSNIEKEKYSTMLTIRDREINELRGEMMKLHNYINRNLTNLNQEMVSLGTSFKNMSQTKDSLSVGDSISSITSDYSVNKDVTKKTAVGSEKE